MPFSFPRGVSAPSNARVATETIGTKLRRLARAADLSNPVINTPWAACPAWATTTAYSIGRVVSNASKLYVCLNATSATTVGTSGATAPTHTDGSQYVDGTCTWNYYGPDPASTDPLAPTLTVSSSVPGGMTNQYSPEGAASVPGVYRLTGGRIRDATTQPTEYASDLVSTVAWNPYIFETGLGAGRNRGWRVSCEIFDNKFTLVVTSNVAGMQLIIDGRYYCLDGLPLNAATRYYTFEFTKSTRLSHSVIVTGNAQKAVFGGFYTTTNGQIRPPAISDTVRAVYISDSQSAGTYVSANIAGRSAAEQFCDRLGIDDCFNFSNGGRGWVEDDGGKRLFHQVVDEALTLSPDIFVFDGSTNDLARSAADVTTNVTTALTNIRNNSTAPIVVYGIVPKSSVTIGTIEAAIGTAVTNFNDRLGRTFFIPCHNDPALPMMTGTWNNTALNAPVRAKTTSTNEALILSDDNTHLADYGQMYAAAWRARQFQRVVLPAIP